MYIYRFYSFNLACIKYKYAKKTLSIRYVFCACAKDAMCYLEPSIVFKAKVTRHVRIFNKHANPTNQPYYFFRVSSSQCLFALSK